MRIFVLFEFSLSQLLFFSLVKTQANYFFAKVFIEWLKETTQSAGPPNISFLN